MKFRIEGAYYHNKCFPSLNDMLHEAEKHPRAYAKMKKDFTFIAVNAIRRDLKNYKAKCKVELNYTFGEPKDGQKRDYDNIVAAGRKIITDALVKAGVLEDDKPIYLGYGSNHFEYTTTPYIEVEIVEVETPNES